MIISPTPLIGAYYVPPVVSKKPSSRRTGIFLILFMVISSTTPLISSASNSAKIELDLSEQHLLILPGTTANITLTIHNNDSQINDYSIELNPSYNPAWNINIIDSEIENVLPTFSESTTIVVSLDSLALLSDDTTVEFLVNQTGGSDSATIEAFFSVHPHYEASLNSSEVGDNGLIVVNPGSTTDVNIEVMNLGNMNDTILLDVIDEPDLIQWWSDYTSNESQPEVNGNETITLVKPIFGAEFDISTEDIEITTNASGLTPNLEYDLDIKAVDSNGLVVKTWNSILNSTNGAQAFSTLWSTTEEGNITIWSNVSFNGSLLSSDFSDICLYDVYGCSIIAQYSLSEGTITGNGTLLYSYDSNGSTYTLGDLVDNGTVITIEAIPDDNWSFTEFNGDLNSTVNTTTIEIDEHKTVGALFEENETIILLPEIQVSVTTNSTHMFSVFEYDNLTQSGAYQIFYEVRTNTTFPVVVEVGWDNFTASTKNGFRYYNQTFDNGSYCITVSLYANLIPLDSDSFCFDIPSSNSQTTMQISMVSNANSIPEKWTAYWLDDVFSNMSPMSSDIATLRITIPNGTAPGYLGLRLWASSTQGNVSMSTVIVIQVGSQDSVGISDVTNHTWLPDTPAEVKLEIKNNGNRAVGYDYSTESTFGPCDVVVSSIGSTLGINETELAYISVRPWEVSHRNDTCGFNFIAENRLNSERTVFPVLIRIGVSWGIEIYSPESKSLEYDETTTVTFTVKNLGTEQDEFRVETITPSGISATPPPGLLTIARGQTDVIDIDFYLEENSDLTGKTDVIVKVLTQNGASSQIIYSLDINGLTSFELIGPQDSRLSIDSGSSEELKLDIINTGTQVNNYNLKSISGIPSCISLNGTDSNLSNAVVDSVTEISIGFNANINCQSGDYPITVYIEEIESKILEYINVTIQISSLGNVDISSSSTSPVIGTNNFEQLILTISNLGSDKSTFEITIVGASGFDVSLESSIVEINPNAQLILNLGIKRTSAVGDAEISVNVVDVNRNSVMDSIKINALDQVSMADLIIQSTNNDVKPGESITGNLLISNQGNQEDNFTISSNGIECTMSTNIELNPQQSESVPFSCKVPDSSPAGSYILIFEVTSNNDISKQKSQTLQYSILSEYISGIEVIEIDVSETLIEMNYDGSTVMSVTIKNLLNERINGTLTVEGSESGSFDFIWDGYINDAQFELDPFSDMSIKLTIIPNTNASISTEIRIVGFNSISSSDTSDSVNLVVDGLRLPPKGLDLKIGELDEQQTLIALFSGWGIILIAVLLKIRKFKNRNKNNSDLNPLNTLPIITDLPPLEDLPPVEEIPTINSDIPEISSLESNISLDTNSTKLESDGTVRCYSCNAKLRPPAGKAPPFRFNCPKCKEIVRVSN